MMVKDKQNLDSDIYVAMNHVSRRVNDRLIINSTMYVDCRGRVWWHVHIYVRREYPVTVVKRAGIQY